MWKKITGPKYDTSETGRQKQQELARLNRAVLRSRSQSTVRSHSTAVSSCQALRHCGDMEYVHDAHAPYTKSCACNVHVTSSYMHVYPNMPVT